MEELIRHFGIDWKLLLAQAVNFFVLLFLLRRFAYKPILRMLKERKREIEKGIEFKEQAEKELRSIDDLRKETIKEARGQALGIVAEAESLGRGKKDEIVKEAQKKAEAILTEGKRGVEEEKAKMGEKVYADARSLIRSGLTKVLGKMPAEERDEKLIQKPLKELNSFK